MSASGLTNLNMPAGLMLGIYCYSPGWLWEGLGEQDYCPNSGSPENGAYKTIIILFRSYFESVKANCISHNGSLVPNSLS